ncbi:MAG: DNA recombination protein RmuC [Nitrospirota bacterium]
MTEILFIILGTVIGGVIAWLFASSRLQGRVKGAEAIVEERGKQIQQRETEISLLRKELDDEKKSRVEALTRLEESQKNLEEQKMLLETMKKEMSDTFNALSKAALESSNESFLTLASERLGKIVEETKGKLGEHQTAMDGMIKPLSDTLKRYEDQIKVMEDSRHKAYGSLEEQLRTLASTHETLQKETSNLVSALRKPQVRGRWGEMQLRRVAELSGMSVHCDFTEQVSVGTETGRLRPDMIIHLPAEREIVVDAKVSLDAYLDAIAASTEEERKLAMKRHAQQIRAHLNSLSSKSYWDQFPKAPDYVVLFIPGESFFSAALEFDEKLMEEGFAKKVILASPASFIAILGSVAHVWRQENITKNTEIVAALGKELYERMNTLIKHLTDIGSGLDKAIGAYNKAVGSMESRVLPSVRKFKELGVTGADEIPIIEQIDHTPRNLNLLEPVNDDTDK